MANTYTIPAPAWDSSGREKEVAGILQGTLDSLVAGGSVGGTGSTGMTGKTGNTGSNGAVSSLVVAPVAANATGATGALAIDATHFYICTAANTWERAAVTFATF